MAYIDLEIEGGDLVTPGPLFTALRAMDQLKPGQVLKITSNEATSVSLFARLCYQLGYKLMESIAWDDEFTLLIRKGVSL